MIYEQVKDLPPAAFKRYCGVRPETFHRMVGKSSLTACSDGDASQDDRLNSRSQTKCC
jgi:hypothetical protein